MVRAQKGEQRRAFKLPLGQTALDQLFTKARTANGFQDRPLPDGLIERLYDLAKLGPTSVNSCPARFHFVRSIAAKERLVKHVSGSNLPKVLAAPATVIIGYDIGFPDTLSELFPHNPEAVTWFTAEEAVIAAARMNATLQGAYLIMAARALGLDCGPMAGFDNAGVDAEFFQGMTVRSLFLCNLGFADPSVELPRLPRLPFARACRVL